MQTLGFIGNIGGWEWLVILTLGLLLFGRRLPEVGRSLGRGIVEFRKGLQGIEDEIEDAASRPRNTAAQRQQALPQEQPAPPLASGAPATAPDVRVSRSDSVD